MPAAAARQSAARTAARLTGVKRAPFPGFVEPCLATLRPAVPQGREWLHEIKFDGYRVQAQLQGGKPAVYTRRGHDWTSAFAAIAESLAAVPAGDLVLDGEAVVLDPRGVSDFHGLQEALARRRTDQLTYYVFDVLHLDGIDLRGAALSDRRRVLADLLRDLPPRRIRLSEHIEAEGRAVFELACAMHLEGVVSKLRDAPYRSGRQETWIKTKCTKSRTYPIVAFVEKLGARPRRIASLYVGRRDGDRLLYAGKVQSGFTERDLRDLRERLDPYVRSSSPLTVAVKKPKATWVEPVLEAEVKFSTITGEGLLREAVFKGIRDDLAPPPAQPAARKRAKPAEGAPTEPAGGRRKKRAEGTAGDLEPSAPSRRTAAASSSRHGVPKENILQLLPDAVVPSKEELAAYWTKVSSQALPHLARRPLKLVRHVRGTTFYHMGPLPETPKAVRRLTIEKREGGAGTRLWVEDLAGLLGLVDIGAVELHPWNATVDDIEHPDTLVIDLDPGAGVEWDFVVASALALRGLLEDEGRASWPKLTGGKGVHVMVPIERGMTHDDAHRYATRLADRLARTDDRYTISAAKAKRAGRLFVDYLRNGRGTTAVGTYSPRARPGFPIAAPATWGEIENGIRADTFTLSRFRGGLPAGPEQLVEIPDAERQPLLQRHRRPPT